MQGYVEIDGKKYVERLMIFPLPVTIGVANGIVTDRLVLPGIAPFLLKAINRATIAAGSDVTNSRRFSFRWGNSDGSIWYTQAGNNQTNSRVVDSLLFGDGRLPGFIAPPQLYTPNGAINIELQDLSGVVPYTVHFAFIGSLLLPV